jgi:hypothetical protein
LSIFTHESLFDSFFLAGFECSEHVLDNGTRLDLLTSTRHIELAAGDFARLRSVGIRSCREGVSWLRSERMPGQFDFSSMVERLKIARAHGVRVIWDLMHFGWPEHVDIFASNFAARFAAYARAVAETLAKHPEPHTFTPINEMSFLAWAGGDAARMNPFQLGRGMELKAQLVAATIAAIESIRSVLPHARFLQAEPLIHIAHDPTRPETRELAARESAAQYQALDMLAGREWKLLGGQPDMLDLVGLNFYPDNQFTRERTTIWRDDLRYRPLSDLLLEAYHHYDQRPLVLSETGAEQDERAGWLRYVADECFVALERGCELHGVTLYPILNHPGWLNDRHCHNGLWDYADAAGEREIYEPLAAELRKQEPRLFQARARMLSRRAERRSAAE